MEQEQRDLWTVYGWVKEHGGAIYPHTVNLWLGMKDVRFSIEENGEDWLNQAAKWVEQQRKEAQDGE